MANQYNKKLEYLLSNNPDEVVSRSGVICRKLINPIFRALLPFTTKNKLVIEKKAIVPKGQQVIFAGTHGFRDDIALTLKTMGTHAYLLYGSIPDFYYSIDGYALWLNGALLVDRKVKASRQASALKMERAIELGSHVVLCPEGVWNKSPNLLVLKLFPGIYNIASKKNIPVIPIGTIIEGKNCYSKAGDAYDITKMNLVDYLEVIEKIRDNIEKMLDLMMYPDSSMLQLKEELLKLVNRYHQEQLETYVKNIAYEEDNIDEIENKLEVFIEHIQFKLEKLYEKHCHIVLEEAEQVKEEYVYNSESIISIRKRVIYLLKTTMNMKRQVALEQLRDKMATLKLELMAEHSRAKRSDFDEYDPISSYWDQYLDELIKTANGLYDYEIENKAHFVDKNEFSQEEVFEPIDVINQKIAKNAKHLVLKNKKNKCEFC